VTSPLAQDSTRHPPRAAIGARALFDWRDAVLSDSGPACAMTRLVLCAVAKHVNKETGYTFAACPTIAVAAGVEERTVRRALQEAKRSGWLHVEARKGMTARLWPTTPDLQSGPPRTESPDQPRTISPPTPDFHDTNPGLLRPEPRTKSPTNPDEPERTKGLSRESRPLRNETKLDPTTYVDPYGWSFSVIQTRYVAELVCASCDCERKPRVDPEGFLFVSCPACRSTFDPRKHGRAHAAAKEDEQEARASEAASRPRLSLDELIPARPTARSGRFAGKPMTAAQSLAAAGGAA
jgi:hypothetical protein